MSERLPVAVIVGRPNVGKSTLFNRLIRRRVAVVEDQPGVTRDRLYGEANWDGKRFTVVDTGGIVFDAEDPLIEQVRLQAEIALAEADVVLFLTEATAGVTPDDRELADRLRGSKKPVLIVVNKVDNPQREALAGEFYELGIGDVFPVSSLHGRGVSELIDVVLGLLPEVTAAEEEPGEIRMAILGRPNVGKSSLLNAFTGERRAVVSAIPGTTRDAVDTLIQYRNERFRLVDTAGMRRRGKIQGSIEYYMTDRAVRALERADVALILIDGGQGLTDGDKRVAKLAHDKGKAVLLAANKWDLKEPPDGRPGSPSQVKRDFEKGLRGELPELGYAPLLFASATESAGLKQLLDAALSALDSYCFRIATGPLNRLIQDAVFERPHSSKGRALKVYYCTQVSTRPPTFAVFCNDPGIVHFSYLRYLENQFRKRYPLVGTSIRWRLRSSHERK
jgi:GTP-binding protein